MKMTTSMFTPFFTAGTALPMPPRFEGFGSKLHHTDGYESHAPSRFDIQDPEGHVPEIICRLMLGLCLAYTVVVCLFQLAAS